MKKNILDTISRFLAELMGTGLLVFLGCMGCISMKDLPNNTLQMSLIFGLVVTAIIQMFGCVSGAHINPAVTVAAYVYKKVTLPMAAIYFVAQMLGAWLGFGLLTVLVPAEAIRAPNAAKGLCSTVPRYDLSTLQAVSIEFIITMSLILLCCGVWDPRNAKKQDSVPITFGLLVAFLSALAGPWTGCSMNPARSFGPAFWNGDFKQHWIYWFSPLLSSIITSLTYRFVFWRDDSKSKENENNEEFPLASG